jgi:hypothetical protein
VPFSALALNDHTLAGHRRFEERSLMPHATPLLARQSERGTKKPVLDDLAARWLRTLRLGDEHVKIIAARRISEHRDKRQANRACC